MTIIRKAITNTIQVDTVLADAQAFEFGSVSGGLLFNPSGSSATSFDFHAYDAINDVYSQLEVPSLAITAGQCKPLPDELFGASKIKITADADVTAVICLKQ